MPGWTRQALWFGPGSFLIVASGVGRLRAWHIKIPSICLDAFAYHVSYSSCQPYLSPFWQSHPLPSSVQPMVWMWQCPPWLTAVTRSVAAALCALHLPAQNHSIFSCPWGSPCHLAHPHSLEWQTPRSSQGRQAWSILGTLRTHDWGWGVWKLVGIAAAGNQSLDKSIFLLKEYYLGFWFFFFNADGFLFPCKLNWDNCRVSARMWWPGDTYLQWFISQHCSSGRLAAGLPDLCCFSSSECSLGLVVILKINVKCVEGDENWCRNTAVLIPNGEVFCASWNLSDSWELMV